MYCSLLKCLLVSVSGKEVPWRFSSILTVKITVFTHKFFIQKGKNKFRSLRNADAHKIAFIILEHLYKSVFAAKMVILNWVNLKYCELLYLPLYSSILLLHLPLPFSPPPILMCTRVKGNHNNNNMSYRLRCISLDLENIPWFFSILEIVSKWDRFKKKVIIWIIHVTWSRIRF